MGWSETGGTDGGQTGGWGTRGGVPARLEWGRPGRGGGVPYLRGAPGGEALIGDG